MIGTALKGKIIYGSPNRSSAQITAHVSVADVPVSNLKDLDLNQGDIITNAVVNICMT